MSQPVLSANKRELTTKGGLNSLRREGRIPAVVYNRHGTATPISILAKEFEKETAHASESTIFKLSIDGTTAEAFIKDRQLDWIKGSVVHVDFFEVEKDQMLHAKVSIHLVGVPIGVRNGGILENPAHEIEVECLPGDLPPKIEVDVTDLEANHSLHVRDIKLAPGVKVLTSGDLVFAVVKFAKIEVEPVVEVAEVEAEAAIEGAPATDEKSATDKTATDKTATDRTVTDRTATDRAVTDRTATDRTATDRAPKKKG
ncbi:MAG: 50S ribosomal protein L25 [Spirochaetes bacterium]|nr:50S ribosomal protein L25 [Spirochaetota bacterium]